MKNTLCPLTGYQMNSFNSKIAPTTDMTFTYEFSVIGKARIAIPTYDFFVRNGQFNHPELAGICRLAKERGEEPPLINADFMANGIYNIEYPKSFAEKVQYFLKYMYDSGGNDYLEFDFLASKDFPLAFATDEKEFNKIIKHLEDRSFIRINTQKGISGNRMNYKGVVMTDSGIAEVQKELPNIPMIGLVDQKISTGDLEVDNTINHAKRLFFEEPQNMDKMRSACESLSYILEPLRKICESLFGKGDTNTFFKMVNEFDIRHNKEKTRQIQYPEQLEWIFYSLLNSLNTYTKINGRLIKNFSEFNIQD